MLAHLMAVVTACLYEHAGKWNPHNYGGILHVAHTLRLACPLCLQFELYKKNYIISKNN